MMLISLALSLIRLSESATWSLSTDDTRVSIGVEADAPTVSNLGSTSETRSWCDHSPVALIDHVWVDEVQRPISWHFVRANRGQELTLLFRSDAPSMELRSIWRARRGAGPIEHRVEIKNLSSTPIAVPEQASLSMGGLDPAGKAEVWWSRRGASNALTQGGVFQEPVRAGMNLNLESNHHQEDSPVPWLAVQVGQTRGLYLGWEFSSLGQIHATASRPDSVHLDAGLMPNFKTDIMPGECLKIPAAFIGCYRGDIDAGANRLHRFILEKLRANPPKGFADPNMVLGLYLDAGGDKATEPDVLRCLGFAKSLGLDTFMCDAMWFPACGDWRWDPARFPHGGEAISDAVHGDGMKFGLWCAWNNGGVSSDPGALSVRGPVGHPDWFGHDLAADWQPGPFYGEQACMASDEARAWAIRKTQSLASDLSLDLLKTDVHPMINECIRTDHRHKYATDVSYWSTLGVYDVWDRLRRAHPRVVLENCSGASHIKDFGVIQRCAYTAVTDTLSNLPDRCGIYDSTFYLPPNALMTYTYEQGYGLPGDDPGTYLFRSAMMTAWDLAPTHSKDWSDEQRKAALESVRVYKEWLRPLLRDCDVHHVLPRPDGKHWDGMFFFSPKREKGALFIFRPDAPDSSRSVILAGLEPNRRYRVWSEDGSVHPQERTGTSLMTEGFAPSLSSPFSSDIVYVEDAGIPAPDGWGEPGPFEIDATPAEGGELSWSPSRGARNYRVVVSEDRDFVRPLVDTVVYANHFRSTKLPPSERLYWRVTAQNWGGSRDASEHARTKG